MEKVYSIVRKIYDRSPTDDLNDLDVNTAVWDIFMIVKSIVKSVIKLFQMTEK